MEVELTSKISDLQVSHDFESNAKRSNTKKGEEQRQKLAKLSGTKELPALLTDEEMDKHVLSDLEFR